MGIKRESRIVINCDRCGADYGWTDFSSVFSATEIIEDGGWKVFTRNNVVCPDCKNKAQQAVDRFEQD